MGDNHDVLQTFCLKSHMIRSLTFLLLDTADALSKPTASDSQAGLQIALLNLTHK